VLAAGVLVAGVVGVALGVGSGAGVELDTVGAFVGAVEDAAPVLVTVGGVVVAPAAVSVVAGVEVVAVTATSASSVGSSFSAQLVNANASSVAETKLVA
jgi:hypothetical protein